MTEIPYVHVTAQNNIATKYNLPVGELQYQWRQGMRKDPKEVEDAIIDALAQGSITAWHGVGVICAAQIIRKLLDEIIDLEQQLQDS